MVFVHANTFDESESQWKPLCPTPSIILCRCSPNMKKAPWPSFTARNDLFSAPQPLKNDLLTTRHGISGKKKKWVSNRNLVDKSEFPRPQLLSWREFACHPTPSLSSGLKPKSWRPEIHKKKQNLLGLIKLIRVKVAVWRDIYYYRISLSAAASNFKVA